MSLPATSLLALCDPGDGGSVSYSVSPKAQTATGRQINAEAQIEFDSQPVINAGPVFNTIDAGAGLTSTVAALPSDETLSTFDVSWSGTDANNGSAISGYTIYVSDNGSAYTPWLEDTMLTSATYAGQDGHTYGFYSVATDNAGNVEPTPSAAEATTLVDETVAQFGFSAPPSATAGSQFTCTITALDAVGNTATAFAGTASLTCTDAHAVIPANVVFANGVATFTATLQTAGYQQLEVSDAADGVPGTMEAVFVNAGPAAELLVAGPSSTTAGNSISFTVTAEDQFSNTATSFNGVVDLQSSDVLASVPASVALTNGVDIFSVILAKAGEQTLTVEEPGSSASMSTSMLITVEAAATARFSITTLGTIVAGQFLAISVTAEDQFGNLQSAYTGTVHISSSDGQAMLSADATLTGGIGFFGATLGTAGNQTLTATDTANGSLTGTSVAISVSALAANHFAVSASAGAVTGNVMSFTVTAKDPFNNTAAGYTGTVHFTSSDAAAVLPGNTTLTRGTGVFSVTLESTGNQTITVTDTSAATITGTSNTIVNRGLTVTSLTPTSSGFVATFDKPFNPTMLSLYDATTGGGVDDVLLTGPGAPQTSFHGSLLVSSNDQTITFVKTSNFTGAAFNPGTGILAAGAYTVTFRSATNGFADSLGDPLDGLNNGNSAGSNYVATFVVGATPVVVGIPAFVRGPDSTDVINLPNSVSDGIPLNVSSGSGITSGKFTLQYNPALLSITGVAVNASLTGASLSLDTTSTAGTAVLDFSSPTALVQTGAVQLGSLVATMPNSAASLYRSQALLHWSGVTINGGAIAAQGDDSVEIVAYFGDAAGTANGNLSGADASDISAVATGLGTNSALGTLAGFAAFPLTDPVIIADLNNDGLVDSSDVTLLNSVLAGIPRAQIPAIPTGLTIVAIAAPPSVTAVSPASGSALGGTTVIISGSGFTGATAVDFGPSNAAASFVVNSNTQITATSPPGAAGPVDVTVTTAGGTSLTSPNDRFSYAPIQFLISAGQRHGRHALELHCHRRGCQRQSGRGLLRHC